MLQLTFIFIIDNDVHTNTKSVYFHKPSLKLSH